MKLTEWFPPNIKPVHIGIYNTSIPGNTDQFYSYWNGELWSGGYFKFAEAEKYNKMIGMTQYKQWRGVLK